MPTNAPCTEQEFNNAAQALASNPLYIAADPEGRALMEEDTLNALGITEELCGAWWEDALEKWKQKIGELIGQAFQPFAQLWKEWWDDLTDGDWVWKVIVAPDPIIPGSGSGM